jgi:hypothetical protein
MGGTTVFYQIPVTLSLQIEQVLGTGRREKGITVKMGYLAFVVAFAPSHLLVQRAGDIALFIKDGFPVGKALGQVAFGVCFDFR